MRCLWPVRRCDYAIPVLCLWGFWAAYVLKMGIYRVHLAKRLVGVNLALALPLVAMAYLNQPMPKGRWRFRPEQRQFPRALLAI
jgi:hypothetical protein